MGGKIIPASPLHDEAWIQRSIQTTGAYQWHRCTGKTTAYCLAALALVIQNPGTIYYITDHHGTESSKREALHKMKSMANKLGLEHLTFNVGLNTVVFGKPGAY